MSKRKQNYTIIRDTREQLPLDSHFETVGQAVETATLKTGDYAIKGYEGFVAIERKSLDDLIGCLMGNNRARFERELARGTKLERFAVVVEAPIEALKRGDYHSNMNPNAALASVKAFEWRYRCRFYFADNRAAAARCMVKLFDMFMSDVERLKRPIDEAA